MSVNTDWVTELPNLCLPRAFRLTITNNFPRKEKLRNQSGCPFGSTHISAMFFAVKGAVSRTNFQTQALKSVCDLCDMWQDEQLFRYLTSMQQLRDSI